MRCVASECLVHQTIWTVFQYTLVEGVEVDLTINLRYQIFPDYWGADICWPQSQL